MFSKLIQSSFTIFTPSAKLKLHNEYESLFISLQDKDLAAFIFSLKFFKEFKDEFEPLIDRLRFINPGIEFFLLKTKFFLHFRDVSDIFSCEIDFTKKKLISYCEAKLRKMSSIVLHCQSLENDQVCHQFQTLVEAKVLLTTLQDLLLVWLKNYDDGVFFELLPNQKCRHKYNFEPWHPIGP